MARTDPEETQPVGRAAYLARFPVTAVIATCGGYAASLVGVPLAWLLGALLTTAAISVTVRPVKVPAPLYRAGQVLVGVAVGLTVTEDIVARLGVHALIAPVAAIVSIFIGWMLFPILWRYGGVSRETAFFSLVPAGIAEMADQAGKRGADMAAVGSFHAFRVGIMVLSMPLLIFLAVGPGEAPAAPPPAETWSAAGWTPSLALALVLGVIFALGAVRIGVPSGWILGPTAGLALLSGAGLIEAREPGIILALAQIALGLGIGARFTRETIVRLPKALAVGLPLMIAHAAVMVAGGLALAYALGLDPVVLALGLSTGGLAEMVLTAKAVGADAALVTGYQIVRGLAGNLLAGTVFDRTVARSDGAQERSPDD